MEALDWVILILLVGVVGFAIYVSTPAPRAVSSVTAAPVQAYKPESWCFVGENTLGRYCVKSEKCGPLDRFPSREACEYTEASALPLGVTGEGGLYYTQFLAPRVAQYHTF